MTDEFAFEASASTTIDVPPAAVFDAVSDIERMGAWSPECTGGEWVGDERGVGARFLGHNRSGSQRWTTECEVLVAERPTEFAWDVLTLAPAPRTSVWRFRIEPAGDGGSSLVTETFEMTATPLGFRRMLEAMPPEDRPALVAIRRTVLTVGMIATLEALQRELERGRA